MTLWSAVVALVAVIGPWLLYSLLKRTTRPLLQPRSEEDWLRFRGIALTRAYDAQTRPPSVPRAWLRLWSHLIVLALLYALMPTPTTPTAPTTAVCVPTPCLCAPCAPVTPPRAPSLFTLLGVDLPSCLSASPATQYCTLQHGETVHEPTDAQRLFLDEWGALHFWSGETQHAPARIVSEASVLGALAELSVRHALQCVCPPLLGLRANISFLARRGGQQWLLLYRPRLLRSGGSASLVRSNVQYPLEWTHYGGEIEHYSEFMIEFDAVIDAASVVSENGGLLRAYNERVRHYNVTVLRQLDSMHHERLPLRLAGTEAACFSHCQAQWPA